MGTLKNIFSRLGLNGVLLIVLLFAVIHNSIVHFSSPAYTEYRSKSDILDKKYTLFEKRIFSDLLPMIYNSQSNLCSTLVSSSPLPVSSHPISSVVSNTYDSVQLDFKYFYANEDYFSFDGRFYRSGDSFYGSQILSITPTAIITSNRYFIKPLTSLGRLNGLTPAGNDTTKPAIAR